MIAENDEEAVPHRDRIATATAEDPVGAAPRHNRVGAAGVSIEGRRGDQRGTVHVNPAVVAEENAHATHDLEGIVTETANQVVGA